MKTYPLDITARHIPKPTYAEYFAEKFTAIIGGQCKNQGDIMDRILLANSLLDNATQIIFVGEIGLAAIHALGIQTGRLERFEKLHH